MATLAEVAESFDALANRFEAAWKPFASTSSTRMIEAGGWQHPAIAPVDLCDLATDIADRIRELAENDAATEEAPNHIAWLKKSADLVQLQNAASDPLSVLRSTIEFLLFSSTQVPPRLSDVDWRTVGEKGLLPKEQIRRLSSIEANLAEIEPRISGLSSKIQEIDNAHQAAEQLPIALEQVKAVNAKIDALLTESTKEAAHIEANRRFEPRRVCRRLQLLSRMEHHEQDHEQVFP